MTARPDPPLPRPPPHPRVCRQWYYYYLSDEGIEYLRQYLHLPAETVPLTHKKPARPAGAPERAGPGGERRGAGGFGERRGYGDKEKGVGAPEGFRPRFGGAAGGEGEYRRRAPAAAAGAPPA